MASSIIKSMIETPVYRLLQIDDVNNKISVHSTYREADILGKLVKVFVLIGVTTAVPDWEKLFSVPNVPPPSRLQRFLIDGKYTAYITANNEVCVQNSLPIGNHSLIFDYIAR